MRLGTNIVGFRENPAQIVVGVAVRHPLYQRWRRPNQSALADLAEALASERLVEGRSVLAKSRSHSRGVSVAAVSSDTMAVGIDVEWMSPDRRWLDIISMFAPSAPDRSPDMVMLAKAWTFIEAFYKAEQAYPVEADVMEILHADLPEGTPITLLSGASVQFTMLAGGFPMAVYWTAEGKGAQISYVFAEPADIEAV